MHVNPMVLPAAAIATGLFWLGAWAERTLRSRSVRWVLLVIALFLALPGLLFVAYYTHLFDHRSWMYSLRAMTYSELLAGGLGLLAGVAHSWTSPETRSARLFVPLVLASLLVIPYSKALLSPLETAPLSDHCANDVCLQNTLSTCGPASAATVLRHFGRSASEKELAAEAFTSRGGTESWYLARAIRRRGLQASYLISDGDPPELPGDLSIAGVVLPGGHGHFVAILGQSPEAVTIADPLKGKLIIAKSDLSRAYHFTGVFLVVRQP